VPLGEKDHPSAIKWETKVMRKFYKRIDGVLHYHEAWTTDGLVVEHWGVAGESGNSRESNLPIGSDEQVAVSEALSAAVANGYVTSDEIGEVMLFVEYPVDGFGTDEELKKRHALEDRLNETLGWTGLGRCDGGSSGSGTMEVCCFVVDFETAKRVIEKDLAGTNFEDYSRIYREDLEE
jgi:hypothetical protein